MLYWTDHDVPGGTAEVVRSNLNGTSPSQLLNQTDGLLRPKGIALADAGGGGGETSTPTETPTDTPTRTPTATPTDSPSSTPTDTPTVLVGGIDAYAGYKAQASKKDAAGVPIPGNAFPSGWIVTLDDTVVDNADADDPENFVVKKGSGALLPAMIDDGGAPADADLHYLRYQIKRGRESVAAAVDGKFPKPAKHVKRIWELDNQFGNISVESTKESSLLVPSALSTTVPLAAPADASHFVCYKVKPAKPRGLGDPSLAFTDQTPGRCSKDAGGFAKQVCLDDADCGGAAAAFTLCAKPKFRKDIQAFAKDQLDDCALLKDGITPSFDGSPVAGMCLFDIKKPTELCNPTNKSETVAPRETTATIDASTATATQSLLCYQAKLASKVRSTTAASLAGLIVDDKVDPKQAKHFKRKAKDDTQIYTTPGNQFPNPLEMDTAKTDVLCIPTDVVAFFPKP